MTRKIIIAGLLVITLAALTYICTELAFAERSYSAIGGEACVPIITFCLWAVVKTVKDVRKGWK